MNMSINQNSCSSTLPYNDIEESSNNIGNAAMKNKKLEVPVINLSLLPWKSGEDNHICSHKDLFLEDQEFKKLREACESLGVFCISHHSISPPQNHQTLNNYRDVVESYTSEMRKLSQRLLKLIVCSLGLDVPKHFESPLFQNSEGFLKLNYNGKDEEALEELLMTKAMQEKDHVCLAMSYQAEEDTLEIRKKCGEWIQAKVAGGSFLVSLGPTLQTWSNGRYCTAELCPNNDRKMTVIEFVVELPKSDSFEVCCPKELENGQKKNEERTSSLFPL